MRITKLYIKSFKNLQEFNWELNPEYPVAVIVGKNASGKSNLLEAILMIFIEAQRDIENKFEGFPFEFEINYQFDLDQLTIKYEKNSFVCTKNEKPIDPLDALPNKIVSYYAGISERMLGIIKDYVINKKNQNRSFNIIHSETIHYKIALLALLASKEPTKRAFLEKFNINEFITLSLKIQKPDYTLLNDPKKENYWSAPENLKLFFDVLTQNSSVSTDSKEEYHIILSGMGLEKLINSQIIDNKEVNLFNLLSSAYATGYIKDIDVRFKKKDKDGVLTFELLSEGEKQKIGIQGAVVLFLELKTLFLLDEPDAFAHPSWQWNFVPELKEALDEQFSSQAIFVTHSPLVLSTVQDNAFVMESGGIKPIYGTYGQDVTFSLAKMGTDDRLEKVQKKLDMYFAYIQSGEARNEEAIKIKKELEEEIGINHPELQRATVLETLFQ